MLQYTHPPLPTLAGLPELGTPNPGASVAPSVKCSRLGGMALIFPQDPQDTVCSCR